MKSSLTNVRRATMLSVAIASALSPCAFAIDPGRVLKGDVVIVATDNTEFYVNRIVVARLTKNTAITVIDVEELWIGGSVDVDGNKYTGWVHSYKLFKQDDPTDVAALKKHKIRLENDYLGNVLRIDAKGSSIPGEALSHLKGLYNLEGLELSGTKITNDDLKHLEGLTNLQWLYLDNTRIDDKGLVHLKSLINLEVLVLNKSQVKGPGLVHLRPLKKLRVLNLSECKISDDSLQHIQGLGAIQTLALEKTPIDGSGLEHLQGMPRLNVLNLNDCKLKDKTLLHLKGFEELRILYLHGAKFDKASKDALKEAIDVLAIFDD